MIERSIRPARIAFVYDPQRKHIRNRSNVPLLLEPAVDQSRELVEEVAQSRGKVWRKKISLSLDLPGCQLLYASCLEYTTCSLKLNGENFPSWASTFCHMLHPEPYIRPKLPCLSPCCRHFLPQNAEEKPASICHVLIPPKPAVAVDSFRFSFVWLSESPKRVLQWPLRNNDPKGFVFSIFFLI